MKRLLKVAALFYLLLSVDRAFAVPSYSRQTGLSCAVCHTNPPQLTAYGRDFKLKGYVLSDMTDLTKVGNSKDLLLSKNIPLSLEVLLSETSFQTKVPGAQNNTAGFPQALSLIVAGGFASHFGGLAHLTYTHSDDHFGLDDVDLRYANQGTLAGKDWLYGVLLSNTPTAEDVWNSTPSWGFPWISSRSSVGSIASPVIGSLGADVAGIGAYSMWNKHLYTDVTVYRSEHAGSAAPITGTGNQFNISGVAPYWRAAWQQNFAHSYLMVGTYGIYVNSFPGAITGPEDRYVDPAIDFQYEHPFGSNLLDAHGSYTYEKSNLGATFAAGGATTAANHLHSFKLDSTYHWTNKYNLTGGFFSTTGNGDPLLYAPAPVMGSNNGSPNTSGYIARFGYWPVQNIVIDANYTGYWKFNGAGTNYDGANRSASDNNSAYVALQLNF
jgi:hypothetical protein